MEHIKGNLDHLRTLIEEKAPQLSKLLDEHVEVKTQKKVKKEWVVAGLGVFVFLLFIFGDLAGLLCNLVGFVYPAYMSFKAIESEDKEDDTQWLTYWVVYSFFTVLETFVSFLLSWIPFYFAFKLAFLVYLFHPKWLGATKIYKLLGKKVINYVDNAESKESDQIDKVNKAVSGGDSKNKDL